jgi:hypothetical protein
MKYARQEPEIEIDLRHTIEWQAFGGGSFLLSRFERSPECLRRAVLAHEAMPFWPGLRARR